MYYVKHNIFRHKNIFKILSFESWAIYISTE